MNTLTEDDYFMAAQALGCEVAAIKAVAQVEAAGNGFLSDGKPKILFEAHVFSRLTKGKYDITHPRISSRTWNQSLYQGGRREHYRLLVAGNLDREAALQSCSWGKFQIMGENWKACGFESLQEFVNSMYKDEQSQLKAFIGFLQTNGLVNALVKKNWKVFAKKYNGASFWKNHYDVKLETAYKKLITH